ncbi:Cof protein [Syntrophomonas zehnderi OL-4]|uniref:Cof protein n=1 Tax=Syntrophomonas zehnderi OL-4 TaxID=690567 RepID=A0A0E4GD02_9FIRM|nr:HAD family hydrolase [Syntrophomonas zehnderi]CFY11945.1 Cof protein [Syntrophomonas zehnderi OL-4]
MFKAILFDLDGTLLNIDMEVFLEHYFAAMMKSAQKSGYKDVKTMAEQIYCSTYAMIANRCADTLNERAFMNDFLSGWTYPEQEMQKFFDDFYENAFPNLKILCRPFAGIPEMMNKVFAQGYKVVIATNPVFPLTAIKQRMDWAGVGHFPFDLITSYENMHFTKPHPEYYQEITEHIGVSPTECLMVGNDVDEDLPAGKIGMRTFLVEDMLINKGQSGLTPDWSGTLADFYEFIDGRKPD